MGRFLRLHRVKTYSRPCPGREKAYFCYSNTAVDSRLDTKHKLKRTVPFKTFLVPVPFPLVTFETAGTYKKWLWANSAHILVLFISSFLTIVLPL